MVYPIAYTLRSQLDGDRDDPCHCFCRDMGIQVDSNPYADSAKATQMGNRGMIGGHAARS